MAAKRSRCSHVVVSPHAQLQYRQRGGCGSLNSRHVQGILHNMLILGVEPIDLVVQVPVTNYLIALCSPMTGDEGGGWLCFTVIKKGWEVV